MWCLTQRVARMMRRAEARTGSEMSPDDRVADPEDPAVALAMKIMAEEGATGDEAALQAELDAAKAAFDAAPEDQRAEAMARLTRASVRVALAREARRKFEGQG